MNLNRDQIETLAALVAGCDDNSGHHVVWVDKLGCVHVTKLKDWERPWVVESNQAFMFRLETLCCGNGYVGAEAASDKRWMRELHGRLIREYRSGRGGYVG